MHQTTIQASMELFLDAVSQQNFQLVSALLNDSTIQLSKQIFVPPPLFIAAQRSNPKLLLMLLKGNFPPNITDISVQHGTILHFFASQNQIEMTKIAMDNGVELDMLDANKQTALIVAIRKGHVDLAKLLIQGGANMELLDAQCKSAWFWAKSQQLEDLLKLLPEIKYSWEDAHRAQQDGCRKGSAALVWNASAGTKTQKNPFAKKAKKPKEPKKK
ncbi:Ankyrin repeat-containing protein [Spironucleus salmonicida]|uniref:Ankyrin repeat-containing protein n=1 Tax=Spironucleus salmonicida TaxID=348837 RepID=V6LDL4_9EUKA|nr:Ankyrin repeat-containing protein [Spironucleus salmonicida]|eukprot:EST42600.1 Ankyrin repeat-containing protein [Spironucleus salmonicida]